MWMKTETQKLLQLQLGYFIKMKKQNVYTAQEICMIILLIPIKNYRKNNN
jgi:hypothetical protein